MMGFFQRWLDRRRIRQAIRLQPRLRRSYGRSRTYTAGQVRTAGRSAGLSRSAQLWAYATYCTPAEFAAAGVEGDYDALRLQMDAHFDNQGAAFAGSEGLAESHSAASGGGWSDGGGFDGGGGGGGGGGGDGGGGGGGP